jgi:hypothetical protein
MLCFQGVEHLSGFLHQKKGPADLNSSDAETGRMRCAAVLEDCPVQIGI